MSVNIEPRNGLIEGVALWTPFKHPQPFNATMKWAVKTPRGVFGFRLKRDAYLFCRVCIGVSR